MGEVLDVLGEVQCSIVCKGKRYYLPILVGDYDEKLTLLYIDCPLPWTKIPHIYKCKLQNKETSIQREHRLEGPQPWSDP